MQTISSNLAKQTFGQVLETVQREPVLIQKHNHPMAVIVSIAEYDRLKLQLTPPLPATPGANSTPKSHFRPLPVIPKKPGKSKLSIGSQEMIDLVKASELELNA